MTEGEKKFLMDLFERHELSLDTIMCLLGSAAARMGIIAIGEGNEALKQAMADLDNDCMRYLEEKCGGVEDE